MPEDDELVVLDVLVSVEQAVSVKARRRRRIQIIFFMAVSFF